MAFNLNLVLGLTSVKMEAEVDDWKVINVQVTCLRTLLSNRTSPYPSPKARESIAGRQHGCRSACVKKKPQMFGSTKKYS